MTKTTIATLPRGGLDVGGFRDGVGAAASLGAGVGRRSFDGLVMRCSITQDDAFAARVHAALECAVRVDLDALKTGFFILTQVHVESPRL